MNIGPRNSIERENNHTSSRERDCRKRLGEPNCTITDVRVMSDNSYTFVRKHGRRRDEIQELLRSMLRIKQMRGETTRRAQNRSQNVGRRQSARGVRRNNQIGFDILR